VPKAKAAKSKSKANMVIAPKKAKKEMQKAEPGEE